MYIKGKPSADLIKSGAVFIDPNGKLNVGSVHHQIKWFQDRGLVDKTVDPEKIIDLSLSTVILIFRENNGNPYFKALVIVYDDLMALEDINLTVREGEILALVGPSGCGKSTLLNIIGGLLKPTSGSVMLGGDPPKDCLNPLTYVFQDFALLPWRTVEGNVLLGMEHHNLTEQERRARVSDVLSRTGLNDFAHVFPKQLSGGMKQRVGIARALAVNPAVLLLDEPLSALDTQTRDLLLEDFENLWFHSRTTAVYVTHNLSEAIRLADRIAIFSRRPGTVRELVDVSTVRGTFSGEASQKLHDQLWKLIREEAAIADREMTHA